MSEFTGIQPYDLVKVVNEKLKSHGLEGQVKLPTDCFMSYHNTLDSVNVDDYPIEVILDNGKLITIRAENLQVIKRRSYRTSQFSEGDYVRIVSPPSDALANGVFVCGHSQYGRVEEVTDSYIKLEIPHPEFNTCYCHPSMVAPVSAEGITLAIKTFEENAERVKKLERDKKLREKYMVSINCDIHAFKQKLCKDDKNNTIENFFSRTVRMSYQYGKTPSVVGIFPSNEVCIVVQGWDLDDLVESLVNSGIAKVNDISIFKVGEEIKSTIGIKVDIGI